MKPKPVLLWRPGTRQDNQRQGGRQANSAEGASAMARPKPRGRRRQAPHGKSQGKPWKASRRKARGPKEGRAVSERTAATGTIETSRLPPSSKGAHPARKSRLIPDSPFAKLAALKEQMKK